MTCPNGYNASDVAVRGSQTCVAACDASEVITMLPSGDIVCQATQTPINSGRHDIDLVAVADSSQALSNHKHRVYRRKNMTRGIGVDPNIGLPGPEQDNNSKLIQTGGLAAGGLLGAVGLYLVFSKLLFK